MTLFHRMLTITLLSTICVACGTGDSDNQTSNAQALGVDTSKVAGFWDFSSTDSEFPDVQFVELTTDGKWNVYARFPNDPNSQNCYNRQAANFSPIGNDMYNVTSPSGLVLDIGLNVVNSELVYTLTTSDNDTARTFTFPAVQGLMPTDLPVCG